MSADEIFVLVLIVVCVGGVAFLEIRSRRQQRQAADAPPKEAERARRVS